MIFLTNILLSAYDYLDELRENPKYIEYIKLNKEIKTVFAEEFKELDNCKKAFEEVLEYGRNHPDFKKVSSEYSKISKELFSKPLLRKQLALNNEIESLINNFLNEIVSEISPNIPVLNELGIISNKGGFSCGC